jgi:disease resistance protein RPS2
MQVHGQVIMLQRLEFEEAWNLFDVNAGCNRLTDSSAQIRVYAKSIVKMCGGLPLALKIVGQAMASKESEHEWKHAMMLLRQSHFHKVPDAESNLYSVLRGQNSVFFSLSWLDMIIIIMFPMQ